MKRYVFFCLLAVLPLSATTRYVALHGAHIPPFTNGWAGAATNIQSAVDLAMPNDLVLVYSGIYRLAARLIITNQLTVSGAFGAAWTVITPRPFTYIGGVYLGSNNGTFVAFTVSNFFYSGFGAGIECASTNPLIRHCVLAHNRGAARGGGVYYGTVRNCRIIKNTANTGSVGFGGGAAFSDLADCILTGNFARGQNSPASGGGGCYSVTAQNCLISENESLAGGGADASFISNCIVTANRASTAAGTLNTFAFDSLIASNVSLLGHGGASGGTYQRCRFIANISSNSNFAGGAAAARLYNCLLAYNEAAQGFGGASACSLVNCTIARNHGNPGGIGGGGLTNSIVYENSSPEVNTSGLKAHYSCTPIALTGLGNITNPPLFVNSLAGNFHLQAHSPCLEAGDDTAAALPWDLDHQPRIQGQHVDMGCYETVPEGFLPTVLAALLLLCLQRRATTLRGSEIT
ncbi:MAG: hypothetical protein N2595_06105 [bacterium]|nr:hypothetical protein [bacterium]